jgi:uncharacterized protein (TIGR01244 family)
MDVKKINDTISVSPQMSPADMADAAAQGFKTVINNRPDGEGGPDQPSSEAVAEAARAAGLDYIYMPVVSGQITEANIADFQKALANAQKPVLAFCRTGTRCTNLWALGEAPTGSAAEIVQQAADAGYDLRPLAPVLQQRGAK